MLTVEQSLRNPTVSGPVVLRVQGTSTSVGGGAVGLVPGMGPAAVLIDAQKINIKIFETLVK